MRVVVTGTDTGVGKTYVSAALATPEAAYVKAAQTGDDDDAATVRAFSGATVHTLARYPEPLAPATAATRAGVPCITPREIADFVETLDHDLVIVEGAGGLLVRFGGGTIADVAALLDAPLIVVARAGLGTLNHTALTVEAIHARGLECLGIVIGSWPADPDLASLCNLEDLEQIAPVLGRLSEGATDLKLEIPA
jgi:dethiobiotin synthetase